MQMYTISAVFKHFSSGITLYSKKLLRVLKSFCLCGFTYWYLLYLKLKQKKNKPKNTQDSHSIRNWSNIIISHRPWKTSLVRKWRVKGQITSQFYYESSFDLLDPQQSLSDTLRTKALSKLQDSPNYKINKIGPLSYYRGCPEEANATLPTHNLKNP